MARIVRSDYLRFLILNVPMIAVFSAAWISDRYAWLSVVAVTIAIVSVAAAATVLYLSARLASQSKAHSVEISRPQPHVPLDEVRDVFEALECKVARTEEVWAALMLRETSSKKHELETLFFDLSKDYSATLLGVHRRRHDISRLPAQLRAWELEVVDPNAFQIKAGDFEIEHFHGQTNIRVLNPSVVTVEGPRRGVMLPDAPAGLRPLAVN